MPEGKEIHLTAKEYFYLQCGMSQVALLPEEIHISRTEMYLSSLLNEEREGMRKEEQAEELKALYYEQKWGSPLQQFMPDGTLIGRVHGLEKNKALRRYFDEEVSGASIKDQLLNKIENPKLKNAINEIYRPEASMGDGGLADAVRNEFSTGELVDGKSHIQKAMERATNLANIIKKQGLSSGDLEIVVY